MDIDWEFPGGGGIDPKKGGPEDKRNFTLLLEELRRALDEQGKADGGKHYLLTIATAAGSNHYEKIELDKIAGIVDWMNIMTYDIAGSWSPVTAFNAPLYAPGPDLPETQQLCGDTAVSRLSRRRCAGRQDRARRAVLRPRLGRRQTREPRPRPAA